MNSRERIGVAGYFGVLVFVLSVRTTVGQDPAAQLDVRTSARTGNATFVTASNGATISVQASGPGAAVQPIDFFRQYGDLFGISDADKQLRFVKTRTDVIAQTHTTFHQVYNGVRVFAGVLKVHQNDAGAVLAANGDFFSVPPKLSVTPTVSATKAEMIARARLGRGNPDVEHSELVVVDPGWYGDPAIGPHLAYYVVLNDPVDLIREAFFVDAHTGAVLDRWTMIHTARDRQIHDAAGSASLPGPLVRSEGQPPSGIADVDTAYDYAGDTYDYYDRAFGRDSMDDNGMPLVVTVRSTALPCPNAAWNGQQMVFCSGLVTDDIMAHELTHAVTEFTANLVYQNQSGQLNEAISDIFGELVDLFNGDAAFAGAPGGPPYWPTHPTGPGTDTPNNLRTGCSTSANGFADGYRWLIGEDGSLSVFRDMWDPTCMGDPDRANSPLETCPASDYGGVHSGSGVANHAFAIMTDGKTFNGQTVTGIGPIKAAAVWYRALTTYLTVASDFEDAYYALNQAATDLIGTDPNDPRTGLPSGDPITATDAEQVDKALLAVEMNTEGACGATVAVLDSTPPVQCGPPRTTVFADDFEGGVNGWTVSNTNPPTPYDWEQTTDPLPFGRVGTAWFAADAKVGDCVSQDESAVHYLASPVISIPADPIRPTLAFTHYIASEPGFDGGNVQIRVNGGAWQLIPATAFEYNPYNTTLQSTLAGNTNPLAGQVAWSGAGGEWGTSLIDLRGFISGGESIEIRFRFGKDGCTGVEG
jgi:Zn-dependent metalloprotease